MPDPVVTTLLDEAFLRGALNSWKSNFVRSLDDELLDEAVDTFEACPSPMTAIVIEQSRGAVTRVDPAATAVPHPEPAYNLLVASEWMDRAATDLNVAWTRASDLSAVGAAHAQPALAELPIGRRYR